LKFFSLKKCEERHPTLSPSTPLQPHSKSDSKNKQPRDTEQTVTRKIIQKKCETNSSNNIYFTVLQRADANV
jgi:hypothetical protein